MAPTRPPEDRPEYCFQAMDPKYYGEYVDSGGRSVKLRETTESAAYLGQIAALRDPRDILGAMWTIALMSNALRLGDRAILNRKPPKSPLLGPSGEVYRAHWTPEARSFYAAMAEVEDPLGREAVAGFLDMVGSRVLTGHYIRCRES